MNVLNKAVFIDKDGTLVNNVPFNTDISKITFVPGAAQALRSLREKGYLLVLVSNQSGLARGMFKEKELLGSLDHIQQSLSRQGAALDDILYCPHSPEGVVEEFTKTCTCRKPSPGMLLQAIEKWNIAPGDSWMIGDILDDVEAGKRAGCRSILLDVGNETEWLDGPYRNPDFRTGSLEEAAFAIINHTDETLPLSHDL